MAKIFKTLTIFFMFLVLLGLSGAGGALYIFWEFGKNLPDYRQLASYNPPVMTRVHAGDGQILAEFAIEKRVFVPIDAMPRRVIHAFLSAEDKTFYTHPGLDIPGIVRAALTNLRNIGKGRRPVGASTITQQVAKNFLLTNEVSYKRKVKEAILALRIEHAFSKNRILELYLNEIYLGLNSYGVAAAALNYFNKSLGKLSIAEAAYLAALPKAPNNYHPIHEKKAATDRRGWVIRRMLEDGHITEAEARTARNTPLQTQRPEAAEFVGADAFTEEVRRELMARYGKDGLYNGGLSVRTTLNPRLQEIAERTLRKGLETYDRRHGWRGPVARIESLDNWLGQLRSMERVKGAGLWELAVVLAVDDRSARIGLEDAREGEIPLSELKWARPWREDQKRGPKIKRPLDVLAKGDVILVEPLAGKPEKSKAAKKPPPQSLYGLRQVPDADGALVAMDPHTGRVLAMVGGYSYERSQFNRAVQAWRQPGSAFKPFVYLAALEQGYTPSTLILDAPFVIDQGPGLPKWRPANYTKRFYGPSTMRLGLEKSRNLMTVRLAQTIGMEQVADVAQRFGVIGDVQLTLAAALGSVETTLLQMTNAYAMLVNGGKKITPTLIDRVQDRNGRTVFRHDTRNCKGCQATHWTGQAVPLVPDERKTVTDARSSYQMVSMLKGVVERGTGRRVRAVGKPLAGKTGTTNANVDTWFVGFSPDLAVGVFVGFDKPRTLGRYETGSSVPAPIFRDFMKEALAGKPAIPFRTPPGIRMVRVRTSDGQPAQMGDKNVILEAFKPGTLPTGKESILEGQSWNAGFDSDSGAGNAPSTGTGGLY